MSATQLARLQEIIVQSDSRLIIAPKCQGGVLLRGRFYNDIIFPGASLIVTPYFVCQRVHVIGQIQLTKVENLLHRQQGRQHRIQDIEAVQRILNIPDQQQRACLVVNLLCRRLGLGVARTLPPEVIGPMVFVEPKQVSEAYRSYEKSLTGLMGSGRLTSPDALAWQRRQYQDATPAAASAPQLG